jgi:predicted AAA+ superfamily ATPase
MYNRLLSDRIVKKSKSLLILGPRQVGKSTLIQQLKPDLSVNLANEKEYFIFQTELSELERRISASNAKTIFIDEIQRIPRLTNTIQSLIDENPRLKFYLTGSSARKLRKGKANLLPGRVLNFFLAPLATEELQDDWNEDSAMIYGSLPGIVNLQNPKDKKELLRSYSSTYLKEEILAEALVRQVDGFVRFLSASAQDAGLYLDFSKISKKAKIPRQSAIRHFEILEDTLIARKVENDPDLSLEQVDLVKHPRFYFFDLGVLNALRGNFSLNQERVDFLFEHMIFNQIVNSATGRNLDFQVSNFRTRGGLEVDFILKLEGKKFAIECKASELVTSSEVGTIQKIDQYYKKIEKIIIYRGKRELKDGNVWILPFSKARAVLGL